MSIDLVAGRISLGGELNRHTVHHLLDAARTLSAVPHPRWVIEADDIRSCDSTGLRALSACYRKALRHGATMSITGPSPALRRALASLRLDHHLMDGGDAAAAKVIVPTTYPLAKVYEIAAVPSPAPVPLS
ncbi:STAS domain-containing protein [Blastococcus sp. KM273129]|uniref:STAS domain-containing protein n=1 Tax=Blastococcus sp. KM273129 TaxID=2570315 RepID=UPI001F3873BE|nr:STAS domain-containing protein [Blastococcus sp. KM273129]